MSALERNAGREMLDARPLAAAVRRDAAAELARLPRERQPQDRGVATLAAIIGFDEKSLRRILEPGRTSVTLDLADRYCCATDRLLSELYPEAYDGPEGYLAYCRTCRCEVDHTILGEGHDRLILRCRDCDRRRNLNRRSYPPARPFPQRDDLDTAEIIAAYQAGASTYAIGRRLGASATTIQRRLTRAGVELRVPPPWAATASAKGLACSIEARRKRRELVIDLWSQGVPAGDIAARLGWSLNRLHGNVHRYRMDGHHLERRRA